MLSDVVAAPRDRRSALGSAYRVLAAELAELKANRAGDGNAAATNSGAADSEEVRSDAGAAR